MLVDSLYKAANLPMFFSAKYFWAAIHQTLVLWYIVWSCTNIILVSLWPSLATFKTKSIYLLEEGIIAGFPRQNHVLLTSLAVWHLNTFKVTYVAKPTRNPSR